MNIDSVVWLKVACRARHLRCVGRGAKERHEVRKDCTIRGRGHVGPIHEVAVIELHRTGVAFRDLLDFDSVKLGIQRQLVAILLLRVNK